MTELRTLVVYYSRSGNSRAVAEEIARSLGSGCAVEEIRDAVDRTGRLGYWRSFLDGMLARTTAIAATGYRVSEYDLVIVGGPVWVGAPSSPVRSWLRAHRDELHAVAFFLTHGGTARDKVLAAMEKVSGCSPVAALSVRVGELGTPEAGAMIGAFTAKAREALSSAASA
ncbi:MAG: flavodoxin family protein [Gemmatimonadales bacterium]